MIMRGYWDFDIVGNACIVLYGLIPLVGHDGIHLHGEEEPVDKGNAAN